ncbi:hypothetical protein GCM10010448_63440 [Streptomyces glomeratus]|uniref:Uncharacterized protein n=1 Tax=Streptomyces glomeratus TaxID=284452 RepID=A0ABP6M1K5_9ACTN
MTPTELAAWWDRPAVYSYNTYVQAKAAAVVTHTPPSPVTTLDQAGFADD